MKQQLLLYILLIFASWGANSQEQVIPFSDEPSGMVLVKNEPSGFEFHYNLSGLVTYSLETEVGKFMKFSLKGHSSPPNYGSPDLPVYKRLIEVPPGARVQIKIISENKKSIDFNLLGIKEQIIPVQPSIKKNSNQELVPFHFNQSIYTKDTLIQTPSVTVSETGTMHGKHYAILSVAPFAYNPKKNSLEVITDLRVSINFIGVDNQLAETNAKRYYSIAFQDIQDQILNASPKHVSTSGPEKFVILSDTMFKEVLQPFIEWKTKKGFEVIEVYKGDPGVGSTAETMKLYLSDLYHSATENDPAFSYLLIVGDDAQIPAFRPSHISDLYYAEYDGNGDYFPDVMYGRFSARDTAELIPQIEKTLEYEQFLFPDPSFLDEAVMIAGVDGTYASKWGNGQINYANQYYINGAHGINSHTYLYPVSGSSDAQIIQDVSNGVGFVNYTGHGEWDRWLDPRFHISDIPGLQNTGKYPLMIGNGCVTTTFQIDECFGEALLRARHKGALGYIGCSNDSYWDEDYWWAVGVGVISANPGYEETSQGMYDLTFHEHNEEMNLWARTQSQMIFAGNMAVTTGNSLRARYYWEIYHLMGDPSLMVYFSQPDSLIAEFQDTIPTGAEGFQILTTPNVYAGLSRDGQLIAAGRANSFGLIDLSFPAQTETGVMDLVLTGQNLKPLITTLEVAAVSGTHLLMDSISVNDILGNNNHKPDYSETIQFAIRLQNYGDQDAYNVISTLRVQDPYIELEDSITNWGTINAGEYATKLQVFQIKIKDSIPDLWPVTFALHTEDQSGSNITSYFEIQLLAPILGSGTMIIDDKLTGNGNSRLDPGETADLKINIQNLGNSASTEHYAILHTTDTLIQVLIDSVNLNTLESGATTWASFKIHAHPQTTPGHKTVLDFIQRSGPYSDSSLLTLYPGLIYENFESGDFSTYNWENESTEPWITTLSESYEGYTSGQSGIIGHNQISELTINVFVPDNDTISFYRKVSSESDWDFLRFYIDENQVGYWSGEVEWSIQKYPVNAGAHTFKWIYSKDGSVSRGKDRAWIDFIVFPKRSFLKKNVGILGILNPVSGIQLSQEDLTIEIKNYGTDTLYEVPVGYTIENSAAVFDTLKSEVLPEESKLFNFENKIDLSIPGDYHLKLFTYLDGDEIPANDTIEAIIEHQIADLSATRYLTPRDTTVYTANEVISIIIKNNGSFPVSDIPVGYLINENTEVLETLIPGNIIQPGDSIEYSFTTVADMSGFGTYSIKAFTKHSADFINGNDTIDLQLIHVNTFLNSSGFKEPGFNIYPNPFSDLISLTAFNDLPENISISILDPIGRQVYKRNFSELRADQTIVLDLGSLPGGLYILYLRMGKSILQTKIIKH